MSQFQKKGASKHLHRLLQRRTNEASTPAFSLSSAPLPTPTSSQLVGTVSTPLSTSSSTPAPSSAPPSIIAPPSTTGPPSTTALPSTTAPSSTSAPLTQSGDTEQEDPRIDERLTVTVQGKELVPSGPCSQIISKTFLDKVDTNGSNGLKWGTLSNEITEFYWEEFQKRCRWDASLGESAVKDAWKLKAKDRYRGYIYNISLKRRTQPSHIGDQVWAAWKAVWNSEEFKKKSDQSKTNRRKGVSGGKAPPTHTGGSATHKLVATVLEEASGKTPTAYEVFAFTHTKDRDGTTFVDEKAQKVHEFYVTKRKELEILGEEIDETELFYEAVGGHDRKRRIYGLGTYGMSIYRGNSSEVDAHPERDVVKNKIQKLEETIVQQQAEMNAMQNTMKDVLAALKK